MQKLNKTQKAIIKEFSKRSGISVEFGVDRLKMWCQVNNCSKGLRTAGGGYATNGITEYLFYCPENMFKRDQIEAYCTAILFHEMAHATKRDDRIPRKFCDWTGSMEEVIAEMTAKKLAIYFDIITSESKKLHDSHIESHSGWLSRDELWTCMEYAELCMNYILNNWLIDFDKKAA